MLSDCADCGEVAVTLTDPLTSPWAIHTLVNEDKKYTAIFGYRFGYLTELT